MTRERSAQLRDARTAIILWCWLDGQKLTEICRATDRCTASVHVQVAEFIERYTGNSVRRLIYGDARKDLARKALEEFRKTEHHLGFGKLQ